VDWTHWRVKRDIFQRLIDAGEQRLVVRVAANYALRVLPIFENQYPQDHRPAQAIEAALQWAAAPTEANQQRARVASYDAYDAANAADAAATNATDYAAAAYNAAAAARAAANAAVAAARAAANAANAAAAAANYAADNLATESAWQVRYLVNTLLGLP
jgi:hypothetical protein